MAKPQIEVVGLKALQKEIRKTGDEDLKKAMKATNVQVANLVLPDAVRKAPNVSGALARSIRVTNTVNYAAIRAGSAKAVPYAGIIEYGWPARRIKEQKFIRSTISEKYRSIVKKYEEAIDELGKRLSS
jgi:hypothetical protein